MNVSRLSLQKHEQQRKSYTTSTTEADDTFHDMSEHSLLELSTNEQRPEGGGISAAATATTSAALGGGTKTTIRTTNAASAGITPATTNITTATNTTTATSSSTTGNHTRSRWSTAIHTVMRKRQSKSKLAPAPKDGLGIALHRIINQRTDIFRYHNNDDNDVDKNVIDKNENTTTTRTCNQQTPIGNPRFSRNEQSSCDLGNDYDDSDTAQIHEQQQQQEDEEEETEQELDVFCYPPLLSRHNARVLIRQWQRIRCSNSRRALSEMMQAFNMQNNNKDAASFLKPSRERTLRFALVLASVLIVVTGCLSGVATVVAGQFVWQAGTMCLLFLVDWRDLQSLLPATLVDSVTNALIRIDKEFCKGKLYQFREWTASEFETTSFLKTSQSETSSLTRSLWDLPPPTIKEGGRRLCLDRKFLQRSSWSEETVDHVLAIDFCYVMMREHVLVQQARRRKFFKSSSMVDPRASSNNVGMSEDGVVVSTQALHDQASSEAIELQVSESVSLDRELSMSDLDDPGSPFSRKSVSSMNSNSSDVVSELPWLDVGAKIGLRLLNSAHVSRAMASQETTERLMASSKDLLGDAQGTTHTSTSANMSTIQTMANRDPLLSDIVLPSLQVAGGSVSKGVMKRKPVHSLWTSPSAAATNMEEPLWSSPPTSPTSYGPSSPNRPPLSPTSTPPSRRRKLLIRRHSEEDLTQRSPTEASLSTDTTNVTNKLDTDAGFLNPTGCSLHQNDANSRGTVRRRRVRQPLSPGVRVAVPITPLQPSIGGNTQKRHRNNASQYQMGCVVRSERVWVRDLEHSTSLTPNCLSVTVKLERSFLRNGEFANLTFRVMDHWPDRYMPKHSKVPVGSCVATTFGIGVLVGWRVEDDCHIVRSLWRRRGPGSGHAYLNRSAIHGVVEAAVGFQVETRHGSGQVVSYVNGGPKFERGRFVVKVPKEGNPGNLVEMPRREILSCHGSQFIPVTEHIREAAHFQMQLDMYHDWVANDEEEIPAPTVPSSKSETLTALGEIVWSSFLKAVDEDKDFDEGVNEFMTTMIDFLERLDGKGQEDRGADFKSVVFDDLNSVECVATSETNSNKIPIQQEPGFWFTNDILGGVFGTTGCSQKTLEERVDSPPPVLLSPTQVDHEARTRYFEKLQSFLRTLLKTVSYARVACVDKTHFRLGLAIAYDVLLFVRTIVKVQQKNISIQSLRVWKRAFEEIWSTVEPIKDRLQRIGRGIALRMEQQGRKAKTKVIKFVDTVLGDERLLIALEQGDWDRCVKQLESALVQSKIIEKENLVYYRKTLNFLHNHVRLALSNDQGAARRNKEKVAFLAKVIQWVATPRRSLLKLFERDDVLDFFERILVRVFQKEELASRKVVIHALNFHSLRHLRMLKDFSTSGRLWMPVLDAADEEFSYMVSKLPQNTKDIMGPIASLFSLCVAQFHRIADGDLTKDWMDFLLEEDAVRIIHDIDMKLILGLESLSRDVKEMMVVLPYYSNIDDDILNLMDEVDLDEFLREASDAMDDPEKLTQFIREKATIAVQRFLDWLPRISIPVEKRDLMEGWVLTCRGEDGGDLTLSDVSVKKENLVCQIMGGDALFFPMFGEESEEEGASDDGLTGEYGRAVSSTVIEESVLDHIREMLLQAQRYGCWESGVGGVGEPPTDRYVSTVLQGLPVSVILNCAIEMWRNLEIDDDELLEIAIKDVSYHIQLQKLSEEKENGLRADSEDSGETELVPPSFSGSSIEVRITDSSSSDGGRNRFNPRIDPTVLFLDMKNLTLRLDNFMFRIEKNEKRTLLDPVFEGKGSLTIQNVSIRIRVECAKERIRKTTLGETFTPVLILKELTTSLEEVILRVRDTAFGSDWLVNKAVDAFGQDITKVVEDNLREQVQQQAKSALENLNAYFLVNPNMLLNLLGITMDDLDDKVLWV